jgi:hypothetical protein
MALKTDAPDRFNLEFFALQRKHDFAAFRRCCPYGRFLPIALAVPVFGTAFFFFRAALGKVDPQRSRQSALQSRSDPGEGC